jgi:hypothetical protein
MYKNISYLLYSFFLVIPRHLNVICRRFETLCLFHLHRWCKQVELFLFTQPMKMEQTGCFEMSVYKIQKAGNNPKEIIQHSEHGESFNSRIFRIY